MIFRDGAFVSNKALQLGNLSLILLLEIVDILLRDLYIGLQLQDIDEVLTLIGQLLLEVVNLLHSTRVLELIEHVEEHSVLV